MEENKKVLYYFLQTFVCWTVVQPECFFHSDVKCFGLTGSDCEKAPHSMATEA